MSRIGRDGYSLSWRNAALASLALAFVGACESVKAQESEFSSHVIDIGIVVSDIDKSVKFYTEVLGLQPLPGFSVPAKFAGDVGLTDNQPLQIQVLVLGDGDHATKLKLMQLPGVESKKIDNQFIHSQFGVSYLTIHVKDTAAAVARMKKFNQAPVAKSPLALPAPLPTDLYLTIVRDPDGNLIELVGPKSDVKK